MDSSLGEGSTFTLRLPLVQKGASVSEGKDASAYTEQLPKKAMPSRQPPGRSRRPRHPAEGPPHRPDLVDDNADLRRFIGTLLEGDYRILLACDGKEALEKAGRELPDLVVCDVMMPVMDGLQFCRTLKEQLATSHIPVILLTAKSLEDQRAEGYDSGADAYISKPFSEKVLLSRIGNLLKSRILLKEHYLETGESAAKPQENDFLSRFRGVVQEIWPTKT